MRCDICPRACEIAAGQRGFCRARENNGHTIVPANYSTVTAMALDPIEKKPLRRFIPGASILSVGSYGCNLTCGFCQNNRISMSDGADIYPKLISPSELVSIAADMKASDGNIGIAYTYNEPLIGYEYVRDCAILAHNRDLKNVVVTNGYINENPLNELLPHIDAMNIDLKAFNENFYERIGGNLETVKQTITAASVRCHVEVTSLIIPGENDNDDEMRDLASWISSIDPMIPLHISRFFPTYKYSDRSPTPIETIYHLSDIARDHLKYVYSGNC